MKSTDFLAPQIITGLYLKKESKDHFSTQKFQLWPAVDIKLHCTITPWRMIPERI